MVWEPETLDVWSEILDHEIDAVTLEKRLRQSAKHGDSLHLWTETEKDLLREYSPSRFHVISRKIGPFEDYGEIGRYARLAFQATSELVNHSSTLDARILNPEQDPGTLLVKIQRLNRLCKLFGILGMETPIGIEETQKDYYDTLIEAKVQYAEILRNLPKWFEEVRPQAREARLSSDEEKRYAYVGDVLGFLGDARELIEFIVVYGSSAQETDPLKVGDHDNYLGVRKGCLRQVYDVLTEHSFTNGFDGKKVSLNLVEADLSPDFLRMNHDPYESFHTCKVIHGTASFPEIGEAETVQRGCSYGVLRNKVLKFAAAETVRNPDFFMKREDLYMYFQKTLRFIMQGALNLNEGVKCRKKQELDARLAELGITINPYKEDHEYLVRTTCEAVVNSTKLLERFFKGARFRDVPVDCSVIPGAVESFDENLTYLGNDDLGLELDYGLSH
jgi:hypothetical protein